MNEKEKEAFAPRYEVHPFDLEAGRCAVGAGRLEELRAVGGAPIGIVDSALGRSAVNMRTVVHRTADARAFAVASRSSGPLAESSFTTVLESGAFLSTSAWPSWWSRVKFGPGLWAMTSRDYRLEVLPRGRSVASVLERHVARVEEAERAGEAPVRHDDVGLYVATRRALAGPRLERVLACQVFARRAANLLAAACFLASAVPSVRGSKGLVDAMLTGLLVAYVVRRFSFDALLHVVAPVVYRVRRGEGARLRIEFDENARKPAPPERDDA